MAKHIDKLAAGFFVIPGADFTSLFMSSLEPSIRNCRKRLLTNMSHPNKPKLIHRQQLKSALESYKTLLTLMNYLIFLRQKLKERVLIVSALFDKVVPQKNSNLLWELLGQPKRMTVPVGHYTMIAYFIGLGKKSVHWFDQRFEI